MGFFPLFPVCSFDSWEVVFAETVSKYPNLLLSHQGRCWRLLDILQISAELFFLQNRHSSQFLLTYASQVSRGIGAHFLFTLGCQHVTPLLRKNNRKYYKWEKWILLQSIVSIMQSICLGYHLRTASIQFYVLMCVYVNTKGSMRIQNGPHIIHTP